MCHVSILENINLLMRQNLVQALRSSVAHAPLTVEVSSVAGKEQSRGYPRPQLPSSCTGMVSLQVFADSPRREPDGTQYRHEPIVDARGVASQDVSQSLLICEAFHAGVTVLPPAVSFVLAVPGARFAFWFAGVQGGGGRSSCVQKCMGTAHRSIHIDPPFAR